MEHLRLEQFGGSHDFAILAISWRSTENNTRWLEIRLAPADGPPRILYTGPSGAQSLTALCAHRPGPNLEKNEVDHA